MSHYALAALGRDRPGIVEAITRVLLDHGVNVEDSQMTILRGRFSMLLVIGADEADAGRLEADLQAAARELGLEAIALDALAEVDADPVEPTHIVTVYGADHPGIVHAASAALATADCNITDLNTRVGSADGDTGDPLYVVMLEALVPAGGIERLRRELDAVARDQGVEVSVHELERDEL